MKIDVDNRIRGSLMGLAVGDALGYGAEFLDKSEVLIMYPDGLKRYSDIIPDEWRREEQIGFWTDDTAMMIAILDSILNKEKIDLKDIAKNFVEWLDTEPFDVGMLTRDVLLSPNYLDNPTACAKREWENSGRNSAGNGGIMRTAITAIWDYTDWEKVKQNTIDICRLTHYDPRCVGSCVVISYMLHKILLDESFTKKELLAVAKSFDERIGKFIELGYQKDKSKLSLDNSGIGYTLKAMAAGIWAYNNAESYFDGIQQIVMEGGDADTNCAVAGPLLGAKFGYSDIPKHLITELKGGAHLNTKIDLLIELLK